MIRILLFALLLPITVAAQSSSSGLAKCSEEATSETEGILVNSSSTKPKVKWAAGNAAPTPGTRGELQKYFETELFGGTVRGWLVIGIVEALTTAQGSTELKVLEAKSSMTVNGQAKSHFVAGKQVKFLEYDYSVARVERIADGDYVSEGTMVCGRKRGEWKKFAPNGNLIEVYSYNDEDNLDGPWMAFYESNGAKEYAGFYKNGRKTGTWTTYYEDGQLRTSQDHDGAGKAHPYREWHPNGNIKTEGNYDDKGEATGEWKAYREDGTLSERTTYGIQGQAGAVIGFKSYGEAGELMTEGYWNEAKQLQGKHISHHPGGGIACSAQYAAGKLNGPYQTFHANGKPSSEGAYLADTKQGLWKEYYEDGKQRSEIEFNRDIPAGVWIFWHPTGKLGERGTYEAGKKTGKWENFLLDGSALSVHHYVHDVLQGPYQFFHRDGSLAESGEYNAAGNLHGTYARYYPGGKLQEGGLYQDGQRAGKWVTRDERGKKRVVKY